VASSLRCFVDRFVYAVDDGQLGFGFELHGHISSFRGGGGLSHDQSGPRGMGTTSVGERGGSRGDEARTGTGCELGLM
jgi:hypothetical protein